MPRAVPENLSPIFFLLDVHDFVPSLFVYIVGANYFEAVFDFAPKSRHLLPGKDPEKQKA